MSMTIKGGFNSAESKPINSLDRIGNPVRLCLTISEIPGHDLYAPFFMDQIEKNPGLILPALSEALILAYWKARPGLPGGVPFEIAIEALE